MEAYIYRGLDALPEPHLKLLDQGGFFESRAWFSAFYQTALGDNERPSVLAVEGSAGPEALFMLKRPASVHRTLYGATNKQSVRYRPVFAPDADVDSVCATMSRFLEWDVLQFDLLEEDQEAVRRLMSAVSESPLGSLHANMNLARYERTGSRTFEDYLASRSARFRKNLRRAERRLREHFEIEVLITKDANGSLARDYFQVHERSWKEPEPFPLFTDALLHAAARAGALRLLCVRLDGQPVAAKLCVVSERQATLYKSAYDEAFREYGVGAVAQARLLEYLLDTERVTEISYGVGDEPHKGAWLSETRALVGLKIFNTTQRGHIAYARARAANDWARITNVGKAHLRPWVRRVDRLRHR